MRILYFLFLLALFVVIGKSAGMLIKGVRHLGLKFGIRSIYLGLILGFLTSSPELFIGINALIKDIEAVSAGNLLGGIVVLLAFVMGLNIILARGLTIKKAFSPSLMLMISFVLFLPAAFGLDGAIELWEGIALIAAYAGAIAYFVKIENHSEAAVLPQQRIQLGKALIYFIFGLLGIIISSRLIIEVTLKILEGINVGKFAIGAIVFSLGTNLPEIAIVMASWKKRAKYIAFGSLLGSALANIFILGIFTVFKTINIFVSRDFYLLAGILLITLACFMIFMFTGKKLRPAEGAILLGIYIFYILFEIFISKSWI